MASLQMAWALILRTFVYAEAHQASDLDRALGRLMQQLPSLDFYV